MTNMLKELLDAPNLPQLVERAQRHLAEEADRRRRFYDQMDESIKAEFINGEIVLHSPVKLQHNNARKRLMGLLNTYVELQDLGEVQDEKIMVHLSRNSFEPDIAFWTKAKAQGFQPEQMLFPAPDFVVEVLSPSTEQRDREVKMIDYALHGVQEYWLVDPGTKTIEQYILSPNSEEYSLHRKVGEGDELENTVVAGFRIPVAAVFSKQDYTSTLRSFLGGV